MYCMEWLCRRGQSPRVRRIDWSGQSQTGARSPGLNWFYIIQKLIIWNNSRDGGWDSVGEGGFKVDRNGVPRKRGKDRRLPGVPDGD